MQIDCDKIDLPQKDNVKCNLQVNLEPRMSPGPNLSTDEIPRVTMSYRSNEISASDPIVVTSLPNVSTISKRPYSPPKTEPVRSLSRSPRVRPVRLKRVTTINWNLIRPSRAGVIVYVDTPNGRKFCLGVDRVHHELTDFGGGVRYKRDGTALVGALRELAEESLGIFGMIEPGDVQNSLVIYNNSLLIVFVRVNHNPLSITQLFRSRVQPESEVSALVWITPTELESLLHGTSSLGRMYNRVRRLLGQAGRFWELL
jgi:hypothetical protein